MRKICHSILKPIIELLALLGLHHANITANSVRIVEGELLTDASCIAM